MKKIVLSLLALAATMNMMAVTYSAKATITLESRTTYESCEMIIGQSDALAAGLNNGEYAEINMEGRSVAMYVEFGGIKYQHFASDATTMTNLPVKVKTNGASKYNLIISNVTGNFTLKIGDSDPINVVEGTTIIDLAANQAELAFGIINYQEPAPDYGSYQRNVTVGNYGTICLPKAGTIAGGTLFNIGSYENDMIYIDEVGSVEMEAGKPYIFEASADQIIVTYTSDVVVNEAGDANGLYGNYDLTEETAIFDVPADQGNYILYENQYWEVVSARAAKLYNYFAYIKIAQINNNAPAPGRRRVGMAVNNAQTTTGMDELNAAEAPVKTVIDGKMYIIRGEHMFDATGRMVK